jgi:peptidoglycan/xylan/chitin deacetylase (PgdA/CDA1 family)
MAAFVLSGTAGTPARADSSESPSTDAGAPAGGGWIALTFDDGPVEGTLRILDILDAQGVKATFFVQGWRVAAHPEIAAEIVRRGHSLQSHGYGHGRWPGMSDRVLRREMQRADDAIRAAAGVVPGCARPPWGLFTTRTNAVIASLGMRVMRWDIDTSDYAHQNPARLLAEAAEWEPDSVVLGHDTVDWVWTPALGEIIETLKGRGLEFVLPCKYRKGPPPRHTPQ